MGSTDKLRMSSFEPTVSQPRQRGGSMSAKNSMISCEQVRHPPAWGFRLWSRAKACALVFALAVLILSATGCATSIRGRTEDLVIESEPTGARVRLSNGFTGRTPVSFRVIRKEPLTVSVTKDGYEPLSIVLKPSISGKGATQATAGNATMMAGSVVISTSTAGAGSTAAVGASAGATSSMATAFAATLGVVLLGTVAYDVHSGAIYQHASGPVRFILKANPDQAESAKTIVGSRKTDPPDSH
jgi:hypothetical protein